MDTFSSILVDIDAMAGTHPATDRATELARSCHARLKLVDVVSVPGDARGYLPDDAEDRLVAARLERLETIARATGVPTECDVLRGRPAIALIRDVLRSGHDLLVRSHARDLTAARPYGAVDMDLFRQCPCTVWAVGPGASHAPRRVLAAVHATAGDAEEQAVNRKIIDTALLMAGHGNASLILYQAWAAFGEELLRSHASPGDVAAYANAARQAASRALDDLVASFGNRLRSARVELRRGYPDEDLPSFLVSEGIDLVVMGTVARTGIAGFVIGNTAERMLRRLLCSVVAVKPDGFDTPVCLDA